MTDEEMMKRVMDGIPDMPIKVQDDNESLPENWAQSAQVLGIPKKEWVGLTDKEIEDCLEMSIQGTCRAIEAKLKEKNA